jgi:hypothetical protein
MLTPRSPRPDAAWATPCPSASRGVGSSVAWKEQVGRLGCRLLLSGESSSESCTRDEPDHLASDEVDRVPRGACIVAKRRLEAGMPRTHWLLAAAAVLPLLVPSSAVAYPPGVEATKISSAKVCGASECREVSDPKAASALAVGPAPGVRTPPCAGCPGTRAGSRSAPRTTAARCSPTASPSAWCPPPG